MFVTSGCIFCRSPPAGHRILRGPSPNRIMFTFSMAAGTILQVLSTISHLPCSMSCLRHHFGILFGSVFHQIGSWIAYWRSTYALNYVFFQSLPLFLTAIICERRAAEGRPQCITKRWSWAGGRRLALADSIIDLFTVVFDSCSLPVTAPCTAALGYLHSKFRRVFLGPAFGGPLFLVHMI